MAPYGGHYQAHLRSQGQHPKWQLPSYPEKPVTHTDAVMETTEIARENLLHAAEGPSAAELPDIAARAESALKGHARAIELINV